MTLTSKNHENLRRKGENFKIIDRVKPKRALSGNKNIFKTTYMNIFFT